MTLTNQTSDTLTILGELLEPSKTQEFPEAIFNIMDIRSKAGHCVIVTNFTERKISNHGNLMATEGLVTDENGLKTILVRAAS